MKFAEKLRKKLNEQNGNPSPHILVNDICHKIMKYCENNNTGHVEFCSAESDIFVNSKLTANELYHYKETIVSNLRKEGFKVILSYRPVRFTVAFSITLIW